MQPQKKTEADLVVSVPLQKIGGRLVKCTRKLLIKCFLDVLLHCKMSSFVCLFSLQLSSLWSKSLNPHLKCFNRCSMCNMCLHCHLSTFPFVDVTVQGISQLLNLLRVSMCLPPTPSHTHTHIRIGYHPKWQGCAVRCPWKSQIEAAEVAVPFLVPQMTTLTRLQLQSNLLTLFITHPS